FGIVPHLNAGGRMLSAETGVTLLTAKDEKTAAEAAQLLSENNQERRRIQETAFEEAVRIVEESHLDEPVLIIDAPDTHEGIAGIVAGKIKEKYHKPSLILTGTGDDYWKGTGRSIEGFDLYEMLSVARDLFEKFGGHAGACGFLMKKENLPALRTELRSFAQGILQREPEAFLPKFYIDEVLDSSELTLDTLRMFELFEPFGQKNRKPLLCLRQLVLHKPVFMGEKQQHVRFLASSIPCILFGKAAEYQELFLEGTSVDLLGYAEINRWNGSEKIQFVVLDMRCYNE
ncbi:MAG: DHHA1 domain-containing protein, partial [Eubacteriales bacterium]|nr:DHHA1 domain-containing protein [Eubacteriales bacterium]